MKSISRTICGAVSGLGKVYPAFLSHPTAALVLTFEMKNIEDATYGAIAQELTGKQGVLTP